MAIVSRVYDGLYWDARALVIHDDDIDEDVYDERFADWLDRNEFENGFDGANEVITLTGDIRDRLTEGTAPHMLVLDLRDVA